MTTPKVLLRFDTEDYVTPESNTALYDILQVLEELKIRATFVLVGHKIQMLVNQEESAILDLLQHHSLGYHSYLHSFHPLACEYVEGRSWADGIREFLHIEDPGHKVFVETFDQPPVCYTQPGADWVPHSYVALQQWEIPMFFSDAKNALLTYPTQPFLVNGILTVTPDHTATDLTRLASSPTTLQQIKDSFAEQYAKAAAGPEPGLITLVCHPDRLVAEGDTPWDVLQFANGKNVPRHQWQAPVLKNRESYDADLQALRELLVFLTEEYDFDWFTAGDLVNLYQHRIVLKDHVVDTLTQQTSATGREQRVDFTTIQAMAQAFTKQISCYQAGSWLSPIQAASILCQTLLIRAREGYFPQSVPLPNEIFFPEEIPDALTDSKLDRLGWAELIQGSTELLHQIKQDASFPVKLQVGGNLWIDLVQLVGGVAQAIVTMSVDQLPQDRVLLPGSTLQTAEYVKKMDQVQWSWPIFRYGYRNGTNLQTTRLLSWTLKPL